MGALSDFLQHHMTQADIHTYNMQCCVLACARTHALILWLYHAAVRQTVSAPAGVVRSRLLLLVVNGERWRRPSILQFLPPCPHLHQQRQSGQTSVLHLPLE